MYCKYCGKHVDENDSFCSICGKRIDESKNMSVNEPKSEKVKDTILLAGLNEKRKSLFLIIGCISCILYILNYIKTDPKFLNKLFDADLYKYYHLYDGYIRWIHLYFLRALAFLFIGIFLYAIYRYINNRKPVIELNKCFITIFVAFVVLLISLFEWIAWIYVKQSYLLKYYLNISNIIALLNYLSLCFCFYKIYRIISSKIRFNKLKVYIITSMICLCVEISIYLYGLYNNFKKYGFAFNQGDIIPLATSAIVMIVLLILLREMSKGINSLSSNVTTYEDNLLKSDSMQQETPESTINNIIVQEQNNSEL